jgi:Ser/Thr protein kinase RdoA (MazF antagonist)
MSLEDGLQPPIASRIAPPLTAIDDLLSRYALQRHGEPVPVDGSVLNDNYRVETSDGPRFVRIHKASRTPGRLEREHEVIAWAGARGIPVNPPEADADGRTLHSMGGQIFALFPWLDGHHLERGGIDVQGADTLGGMQGRIHRIFAAYDGPSLPGGGSGATWDTEAAIQDLSRVDDLIRYYPAHSEWTLSVQELLRMHLELLESPQARPSSDFAGLPVQAVHGDYHERNVMLDTAGKVQAVIDWEMPAVIPPAFELLRCVTFAHLLDHPLLESYLHAYRREYSLRAEECEPAVEMWWQSTIHSTWAFRAYYIEGNRRAAQFFAEGRANLARFRDSVYRASLAAELRKWAT